MFVVGRKYKRVVARRGAPIAVDEIVTCMWASPRSAVLRLEESEVEYLIDHIYFSAFSEYIPPITRTFFFIIGERVIGPMNNNENDIHSATYVKNRDNPTRDTAEAMYRRNQPNHRVVSVREISHTYGFGAEVGDMVDDL